MLPWLFLGLWTLAGLAHLLHRWDRRGRRDFLTAYLSTLAVLDVWRATTFALVATTASVLVHLPLGDVTLTLRLFSPVILLCVLMLYAAEGTTQTAVLIAYQLGAGLTWGVILPFLLGLAVVAGWVPIPGELAGPLIVGGAGRLAELLALMVGVYAVIVSYQFITNRAMPRWASGSLALLAGGTVQAMLFGFSAFSGADAWPGKFLGEVGGALVSTAAVIPAAIVSLAWLERRRRRGETMAPDRSALSVLRDTLDLRRSLEESRETINRLSETLAVLNGARHVIVQADEPGQLMKDICQLLVGARHYRFAWIGLKREGDKVVFPAAQAGAGPGYLDAITVTWDDAPTGRGPLGTAIRKNRPHVVSDTRTDAQFELWRNEAVPRGYLSIIGLPMRTGGEVVGGLAVYSDRASAFGDDEIALLQGVADDLAHGLGRVRAEQLNDRRLRQLDILRAMTQDMISLRDLPRLQERMLQRAVELLEGSSGGLYLCDTERRRLRGSAGFRLPVELRGVELDFGEGAAGRAAETKQGVIVPDYRTWPERSGAFAPDVPFRAVMAAPMIWQGEVIGVIDVLRDEQMMPFTSDDLDLLQLFANQAALVSENASLFSQADAERQSLRLLLDLGRDLASGEEPVALLRQAVSMTTQQLGGRSGSGFLVDDPSSGALRLAVTCRADGLPVESLAPRLDLGPGRGLEGWVAEHRQACRVDDVRADPRWIQIPGVDEAGGSAISAPLLVEDRLLGVMTILGEAVFTQDHLDLLEAISRQVALALSNAGRFKELERRFLEQVVVQQVAQVISRRLEMQPLMEEVCRQVADVLRYPNVEILLVEGEELIMRASQGAEQAIGMHVPLTKGIVGRVAHTDRTALVPDTQLDPDYIMAIPTTRSEIVVPLHKGHVVIGVLNVESPVPRGLTEDDAGLLSLLGDQVSVAIENAALYDRLRRHSTDLEQTVAERTARLAEALEQAKEADRLKTQFVADVSHELRTPLTNIRLYLELIGQANRERFEEYLKTLNRETERLVDLIEDLLAISRLDAGTHPPQPVSLNLNELAGGLVADRQRMFDDRKIEVTFRPDEGLPRVVADERMLTQVLANLMTNAMNYTLPGGRVSISTGVTSEDDAEWVTLSVVDTGLGIPAGEVGHVFERFFRGTASRQMGTPGTGLGLSICKEILDRHKGRISVRSNSGEGSTFTIWLPKP